MALPCKLKKETFGQGKQNWTILSGESNSLHLTHQERKHMARIGQRALTFLIPSHLIFIHRLEKELFCFFSSLTGFFILNEIVIKQNKLSNTKKIFSFNPQSGYCYQNLQQNLAPCPFSHFHWFNDLTFFKTSAAKMYCQNVIFKLSLNDLNGLQ